MKNKIKTLAAITVIALMTSFGCKKGDTGPAGTNGTNGTNGNANVQNHTYTGLQWINNSGEYDLTINDAAITQSIIDNGTVFPYFTTDNGATWTAIPLYINPVTIIYSYSLSTVSIAAGGGSSAPSATTWKVVVIAGSARKSNPNVNYKNYEEVKKVFNLKD